MINNTRNLSKTTPNKDTGSTEKDPQLTVGGSVVKDALAESVGVTANIPDIADVKPHPLSNLGQLVDGQVQSGANNMTNINLDDYSDYFGGNVGYFSSKAALDKNRAQKQGSVEQFRNAAGRVALNVVPELVGQIGNALDFEDYFNSDNEVGNWLNTAMQNIQGKVDKALPIYRENPDKPLDYSDNAWWFENGSSLVNV